MTRAETYTLFWEAMSGAMAVELLLEEMELDYTRVPVDMARGEHRSPDFLALNPTGQIPALRLPDGTVIGESAAIILTLGERHPGPLVPAARPGRMGVSEGVVALKPSGVRKRSAMRS